MGVRLHALERLVETEGRAVLEVRHAHDVLLRERQWPAEGERAKLVGEAVHRALNCVGNRLGRPAGDLKVDTSDGHDDAVADGAAADRADGLRQLAALEPRVEAALVEGVVALGERHRSAVGERREADRAILLVVAAPLTLAAAIDRASGHVTGGTCHRLLFRARARAR